MYHTLGTGLIREINLSRKFHAIRLWYLLVEYIFCDIKMCCNVQNQSTITERLSRPVFYLHNTRHIKWLGEKKEQDKLFSICLSSLVQIFAKSFRFNLVPRID